MKEHIQAAMVNEICDTARRYHNYGCLRTLISEIVDKANKKNREWCENEILKSGIKFSVINIPDKLDS